MEHLDIRMLEEIAAHGSLNGAAKQMGYAQSSLTTRVNNLERVFGTPLLSRSVQGTHLTPAGRFLLQQGRVIAAIEEDTRARLRGAGEPTGSLRVGVLPTLAAPLVKNLLTPYHKLYPQVQLSLETGNPGKLSGKLLKYGLDVAFSAESITHPELETTAISCEEIVVLAPPQTATIKLDHVLSEYVLVLAPRGCVHRSFLERYLAKEGLEAKGSFEFTSVDARIAAVSEGIGITPLPRLTVQAVIEQGRACAHELPAGFRCTETLYMRRKDVVPTAALLRFEEMALSQPAFRSSNALPSVCEKLS